MGQSPDTVCPPGSLTFLESSGLPIPQAEVQTNVEILIFINFITGKFHAKVKGA
jgi:hypothetical protein